MKRLLILVTILAFASVAKADPTTSPTPNAITKTYPDGAVLTMHQACAESDVCATIQLSDGDVVEVLNGGHAQATAHALFASNSVSGIKLTIVRRHGDAVLSSTDKKIYAFHGANPNDTVVFDEGAIAIHFAWDGDANVIDVSLPQ